MHTLISTKFLKTEENNQFIRNDFTNLFDAKKDKEEHFDNNLKEGHKIYCSEYVVNSFIIYYKSARKKKF